MAEIPKKTRKGARPGQFGGKKKGPGQFFDEANRLFFSPFQKSQCSIIPRVQEKTKI
jgi:hypothetical protein